MTLSEDKYVSLCELFAEKGCKLLSSREEIEAELVIKRGRGLDHVKVRFVAKCEHENSVTITNFKCKSSGVTCKDCMKKQVQQQLREKHDNNEDLIDGAGAGMMQECDTIRKLETLFGDKLTFQKTREGCSADFIIKPCGDQNLWMKIQLKTTFDECHNLYTFHLHNNGNEQKYVDHLILCHCVKKSLYWLIPFENVNHIKNNLNIGKTEKSVYYKYFVDEQDLSSQLLDYYSKTKKFDAAICMTPTSEDMQTEVKYANLRRSMLPYIDFVDPPYDNSYVDFLINGYKIQEKVGIKRKDRSNNYAVCIRKTLSRRTNEYSPYIKGMNEFYWVNITDTKIFFIFPEEVLINHGFIKRDKDVELDRNSLIMSISLNNKKDFWYDKYMYNYNEDNRDKLCILFNLK